MSRFAPKLAAPIVAAPKLAAPILAARRLAALTGVGCLLVAASAASQNTPEIPPRPVAETRAYSSDAIDLSGLATFTRPMDESYPLSRNAIVSIRSKYGVIRVRGWDNPVARVTANVTVGAVNGELARQYAEKIAVDVQHESSGLSVETIYPAEEFMGEAGGMRVDYDVSIPRTAHLMIHNAWGDTLVEGINGDVTLLTAFGAIELKEVRGFVRAHGSQFPFVAHGLHGGGIVNLRRADARVTGISGPLSIENHWGTVELRDIDRVADINIDAEDGPIHLYLAPGSYPNIEAQALYGAVETGLTVDRRTIGDATHASLVNVDATQRIELRTSFDSIFIYEDAPPEDVATSEGPDFLSAPLAPVVSESTQAVAVPDGHPLRLEIIRGNVVVQGTDEEQVTISARKYVEVASDRAMTALDQLNVSIDPGTFALTVRSETLADLDAMGCASYGVDFTIGVPRISPVTIVAASGTTRILDTGGAIAIEQGQGDVVIEHATGNLNLVNHSGNTRLSDCAGPVEVNGAAGRVELRNVYGDVSVTHRDGMTVIESPQAGARVRQTGGDVRILAPDGIFGEFDIDVEDGNIGLAVPETTDASFWMTAHDGAVYSGFPVSGTKDRGMESFQGQMNSGMHRVLLKTRRGNIVLD